MQPKIYTMFRLPRISVSLAVLMVCVEQEKLVRAHEINLPPGNLEMSKLYPFLNSHFCTTKCTHKVHVV